MKLNPYLNFNGNCRAALEFYVKTLGAKMVMCMTYADAPRGGSDANCPPPPSDKIMHGRIQLEDDFIMASDCPEGRYEPPAGFSLNIGLTDVKEAERIYAALSEKGQVMMPLAETFWAKRFAMFKDQFGVPWMINVEKEMA